VFLFTVNGERPDTACLRFEFGGEPAVFHVHFFFGVRAWLGTPSNAGGGASLTGLTDR
jgi:hypothetical protein